MDAYSVAISGLSVAQAAMDLIGTNISNAATAGYHRQELDISPMASSVSTGNTLTAGVTIDGVRRLVDTLLEQEMARQQPIASQNDKELETLSTIEAVLGEMGSGCLGSAINDFFNALTALSAQPDSTAMREQAVWTADTMAAQFRNIGQLLGDITSRVYDEAQSLVQRVNQLSAEVALLNDEIQAVEARQGNSNLLRDQRDQAIMELAELVPVEVQQADPGRGIVNVISDGTPLVLNTQAMALEADYAEGRQVGVSPAGAHYYATDLPGGKLGGLLAIANSIVPELADRLDTLAGRIIDSVNEIQVRGLGTHGSFSTLTGLRVDGGTIDGWSAEVAAGSFHIRVTDASGNVTVQEVAVDPATDTLADVRGRIAALDPSSITAEVVNSALQIRGLNGCTFDFVPATTVDASGLAAADAPDVSLEVTYAGDAGETLTCTVGGTGQVGVTDGLTVTVTDSSGQAVAVMNVGSGYAAGDDLALGAGLYLAIASGTLNDGETFTISAAAGSDDTGFLVAAGMNTFFSGTSATTIAVRDGLKADSGLLATARGADGEDNLNARAMADLADKPMAELGNKTIYGSYQRFVLDVAQAVSIRKARRESLDGVMQQLRNHRDDVSGVDINEEAAKLLSYEKMFQAMSRFVGVQDQALGYLMDIL
jgi:flagellar hook-associated protein 1 FlgK